VTYNDVYFTVSDDNTTKCTSNLVQDSFCEFPNGGKFLVKNLFPGNFAGGQIVDFTINNVLLDVDTKMTTPSW
jgi:hypothetical protein